VIEIIAVNDYSNPFFVAHNVILSNTKPRTYRSKRGGG
jgi:hypothetical protein